MDTPDLHMLRRRVAVASSPPLGFDVSLDAGVVVGRFLRARLTSAFEPVFALGDGRVVGAQATVRTVEPGGRGLAPAEVFAAAARPQDLVRLDRLCRIVHALAFHAEASTAFELSLGVHPRLVDSVPRDHGLAYRTALDALGLAEARVLIELPAIAPGDEARIAAVAASYRQHGFGVAFRPVDAGQLERLLRGATFDALRFDAERLARLDGVGALVRDARRRGIRTIVDRVRHAADIEWSHEQGATHMQGPLFGAPSGAPGLGRPLAERLGADLPDAQRRALRALLPRWAA